MKNYIVKPSVKKRSKRDTQNRLHTLLEVNTFATLRKIELLTLSYPPLQSKLLIVKLFNCWFKVVRTITASTLTTFPTNLAQLSTLDSQIGKQSRVLFLFMSKNSIVFTVPFILIWGAVTLPPTNNLHIGGKYEFC